MHGLSELRKSYLEATIREAQVDGVQIIIYISTLHPVTVEHLQGRTEFARLLEEKQVYLATLQEVFGTRVYDFSSIDKFGGTVTGWYDCGHMDETNEIRVAETLAGLR
jgi:hypothetical protein